MIFLLCVFAYQIVTHSFLLSISAHSGQVAIPWMMNQGRPLYGDILEQHAPGSSVIVAIAQRLLPFETLTVTRLLNIALVLVISLIVYGVAFSLGNRRHLVAVVAVLIWVWWEPVYGNILFYFDTLLGFGIVLAVFIWVAMEKYSSSWLAALSVGVILGGVTIFKQHGWAAVILFAIWLFLFRRHSSPRLFDFLTYGLGATLFPILIIGVVALQGNLAEYIYWNWGFNFTGLMPSNIMTGDFFRKLVLTNVFVPVFLGLLFWRYRDQDNWILLALMWLAGSMTLIPRFDEIHVMGSLPATSIMSSLALTYPIDLLGRVLSSIRRRQVSETSIFLSGTMFAVSLGWIWTGVAPFFGGGGTPGYEELKPVAELLESFSQADDTLFILPETDSTPQLHVLSGLQPPGTWVKGWGWYLRAPNVIEKLLNEWSEQPPDFIVVFPELLEPSQAEVKRLMIFLDVNYQYVECIKMVKNHGDALLYRFEAKNQK